jgi:hypothetical protein
MPFGKYKDFDDCVNKNQDKQDPEAYCATIQRQIEGASVQTGNYQLAVFSEPMHITDDSHCCLRVNAVIAKEGVYAFPAGPNGENMQCLWSKRELLDATPTARAAKITILDHPPNRVVTSQDEIFGVCEKPFFDRDKIRAILNFDKTLCPPQFLEDIRKAEAKQGPPKDVSIGFYYDQDMTPGTWHGIPYDMVMRNIVIDHVAAGVYKGRCSYPNCGIGVARKELAALSKPKNKGGKKQVSENYESDIPKQDEHGCKVGIEKWSEEKQACVPITPPPLGGRPDTLPQPTDNASEGESPTEGPEASPPDDNKSEVDEHGCYIGIEHWSEELSRCVPNREEAPDIPQGETTPQAASLIARSQKLLKMKHDRDVQRLKDSRRHPA